MLLFGRNHTLLVKDTEEDYPESPEDSYTVSGPAPGIFIVGIPDETTNQASHSLPSPPV